MAFAKKNKQIVLLTLFAMTLVVIGHSDITNDFKELWIYKWVYSFHMPLFFFISGFLFCLTMPLVKLKNTKFITFIQKKAIRLLIPFLFINTIIYFIKTTFVKDSSMMQHPVTLNVMSAIDATFLNPMGFMWFLPTLFSMFMMVFPLWKFLKTNDISKNVVLSIIFIMILIVCLTDFFLPKISFMQFSKALHYLVYFLLGILYCDYKPLIDEIIKKYWIIVGFTFLVLSGSMAFGGYISALSGIMFSLTFALILEERCSDKLVNLSSLCYAVFLLSYFPQMFIRGPIAHKFPGINQYILSGISFC